MSEERIERLSKIAKLMSSWKADTTDYDERVMKELEKSVDDELERLRAENAKLRECVSFYAESSNWKSASDPFNVGIRNDTEILNVYVPQEDGSEYTYKSYFGGLRARQCLAEIRVKE